MTTDMSQLRADYDDAKSHMTRPERFNRSMIDVSDLDDEELQRGQVREDDGTFSRRAPKNVPRKIVEEMTRRFLDRGGEIMRSCLLDALKGVSELVRDPNVPPQVRLAAAKWVVERSLGATPTVIKYQPSDPVIGALTDLLSDPRNMELISGTVVDDSTAQELTEGDR